MTVCRSGDDSERDALHRFTPIPSVLASPTTARITDKNPRPEARMVPSREMKKMFIRAV